MNDCGAGVFLNLARYVRGSNGIDYKERIKSMKLPWVAMIGSKD
jgi:aromatic ring hydroxylase